MGTRGNVHHDAGQMRQFLRLSGHRRIRRRCPRCNKMLSQAPHLLKRHKKRCVAPDNPTPKLCANGDGRPICPPSQVVCRECLDKIGPTLRAMLDKMRSA